MSEQRLTPLRTLFASDRALGALAARGQGFEDLRRTVAAALPAALAGHLTGAVLAAGELVLLTDSAAWATRMRFHDALIRSVVRARHGVDVTRVTVRVQLSEPPAAPRPAFSRPQLGVEARRSLENAAASVTDPALAAALRRLARRG
ncbi:MAG TPA: DciA family protein [Gammaproteobacteria bacterium]|nr:DciA family protein [Gammaproteobacteria bacterium]